MRMYQLFKLFLILKRDNYSNSVTVDIFFFNKFDQYTYIKCSKISFSKLDISFYKKQNNNKN